MFQPAEMRKIHDFYTEIFNYIPHLVYWIDECGILKGCNAQFKQLLGIKNLQNFSQPPYQKMGNAFNLKGNQIALLQEEDERVFHTGQGKHNSLFTIKTLKKNNVAQDYLCNRDPLKDESGRTIGVLVVMIEAAKQSTETQVMPQVVALDHPLKVLIIEDNHIARTVEESLFKSLECQVDTAESYQKAADLFQPGKYDLIMMDIELEDANGQFIAKNFRQLEKDSAFHVPIIALTSHSAERIKFYCDDYYMEGAINKPLRLEQAEQVIERYVYKKDTLVEGLKHA